MRARTLDDCLNADDAMARLAAHAKRLQKLQSLFAAAVPLSLAKVCRVANFKAGALIVHAENGAVAAKLRQLAPSLTTEFRLKTQEVTEIRIKVQPLDIAVQHKPAPQVVPIGDGSRAGLAHLADTLPDGPLRDSLRRFVSNGKK